MHMRLSSETIAVLHIRTEGWVAGLQLAALSFEHGRRMPASLATFDGNHPYILSYLTDEVLSQQPEPVQIFLLHTAIVERLCVPLCDALLDDTGSQAMFTRLEQANLFLVPLDEERRWYRYHQLFKDFLLHYLQRTNPDLIPLLHKRASLWYEQHQLRGEAMDHALAAADFERADHLMLDLGKRCMRNGEVATLSRWLDLLLDHLVRAQA